MKEKKTYLAPVVAMLAIGTAGLVAASTKAMTYDDSSDAKQIETATWDEE